MRSLFLVFCIAACFRLFAVSFSYSSADAGFYALSSLRYVLEKATDDEGIEFTTADIDNLWQKALENLPESARLAHCYNIYCILQDQDSSETIDSSPLVEELYQLWKETNLFFNEKNTLHLIEKGEYPDIQNNPDISLDAKAAIKPWLIPTFHPIYPALEALFRGSRITQNVQTFMSAGFNLLEVPTTSYIRLAKHPSFPDYIFKVYLDDALQVRNNKPGWFWLANRCYGAKNIRDLIKKKKIKHFIVPDKYLYPYPQESPCPWLSGFSPQPVILLVTAMNIVDEKSSHEAWKTKVTKSVLDELYKIISHGYGSTFLALNVPYTLEGKFAFIDTEHPKRKLKYEKVRPFLSDEMASYWDKLVKKGGH